MSQMNGRAQPVSKKGAVQAHPFRPAIQPHANFATAVVQAAAHELARVRTEIDLIAIRGIAFDRRDRSGIAPGKPAIKRPRAPRSQDHSWCWHKNRRCANQVILTLGENKLLSKVRPIWLSVKRATLSQRMPITFAAAVQRTAIIGSNLGPR